MSSRVAQCVLAQFLWLTVHAPLLAQQAQPRQQPGFPQQSAEQATAVPPQTFEPVPPPSPGMPPLRPQGAQLTLEQASAMALGNNPVLRKAQAEIDAATGRAIQAGIWRNPRFDGNNPPLLLAGHQSQYNVGVCQEVPVKGKLRLDRAAALRDVEQARMSYIHQRYELLTAVRQQFYRVLAQERRVEVLVELEQIAARSHSAALEREKAGQVAETDVLLLLTELQQARIRLENATVVLAGARQVLAATIGTPNFPIHDALGDLKASLPEFDEEATRQFVATQNAAIREAQLQVSQDRILLRRAQVEPYPNPYIGPAITWGPSSSSAGNYGSQFWLNAQFDIPVWNLNQGNVRAANANIRNASAAVGVLQNDLLRQASETLAAYRAARDRAIFFGDRILPTAIRSQRLVQSAYGVGQLDVSEVLQAQRALTQVNRDYIDTLEEAWTQAAALAGLLQIEQFP